MAHLTQHDTLAEAMAFASTWNRVTGFRHAVTVTDRHINGYGSPKFVTVAVGRHVR